VVAWPGDSPDALQALRTIQELHKSLDLDQIYTKCRRLRGTAEWEALVGLLAKTWMSRLWIVQEVALANENLFKPVAHDMIYLSRWGSFLGPETRLVG
jgi:hypothetical protein